MIQYPAIQITNAPISTSISSYPDTQSIVIYNESPYFMQVTLTGSGVYGLAAYTADCFQVFSGFTGGINFTPLQYIALTAGTAPASVVFIQAYGSNEPLSRLIKNNSATGYPISLNRLQNIGNGVNVIGGIASSVQNDGNIADTSVIETTPVGQVLSSFSLDNVGHMLLNLLVGSSYHQVMKTNVAPGQLLTIGSGTSGDYEVVEDPFTMNSDGIVKGNFQAQGTIGTSQTVAGTISGSVNAHFPIWATNLRIAFIDINAADFTAATAVNFTVPGGAVSGGKSFLATGRFASGASTCTIQLFNSATAQNLNILTALGSGGGNVTVQNTMDQSSIGDVETPWNIITVNIPASTVVNGWFLAVGF